MDNNKLKSEPSQILTSKVELPRLEFLGGFLAWTCFGLVSLGFVLIGVNSVILSGKIQNPGVAQFIFIPTNAYPALLIFFACMFKEPANWLVSLAPNPKAFFEDRKNYRLASWAKFWSALSFASVGILNHVKGLYQEVGPFCDVLISHFYIAVLPLAISFLCIGIVEYYKRWMIHNS